MTEASKPEIDLRESMLASVALCYLTPERFSLKPQIGLPIEQEWHSFARWLTTPTTTEIEDGDVAKKIAGAWCPCALIGGVVARGRGTFDTIAGDVDKCGADGFERTCAALVRYQGVVVSTCNRSDDDDRHRFVLALDRRMSIDEFPIVWRKLARSLARVGIVIDPKCKNANRLYFAPVQRRGITFKARTLSGAPVPVDRMLAAGRKYDEAVESRRSPPTRRAIAYDKMRAQRAARYIAKMPPSISGAGGHGSAWAVARKLVADFKLDDADAWPIMLEWNAGCEPPWSEKELRHKLESAHDARIANPIMDRVRR